MTEEISLSKYLAFCGVASRRHAVELIREGLVAVNGLVERNPAARVTPDAEIVCGGRKVLPPAHRHYIMLHKPRGYVCTADDVHAAKKALDLIRLSDGARLFSAGRLDKDSEGLLLFSDDGDFVNRLTHPRNGVCKTYEVSMAHMLSPGDRKRMLTGIEDAGEVLRALSVEHLHGRKYALVLGEGKNREIRRMASALGNEAVRLKRVAVGALKLGSLPCGVWRELSEEEKASAFLPPQAVKDRDSGLQKSGERAILADIRQA